DIYKDRIKAEKNFLDYSVFVCFFPLLVAGPIERATHLLPQIQRKRTFDYNRAVDGLRQILWGLFKKVVIADQCAQYANEIFNNSEDYSGNTLVLGAVFFTFQIYGDFSGYTDIASGVAKLLGFRLLRNFDFPYFSRSIAEFWRKWHISLTSWFRDYLYIPLGGSKEGRARTVRNVFIVFLVSGLWHGAGFTFIIWGLLHALYFLPGLLLSRNREYASQPVAEAKVWPSWRDLIKMSTTFGLVTLAWIFFRAESLVQAAGYCKGLLSLSLFSVPLLYNFPYAATTLLLLVGFIIIEWRGRNREFAIEEMAKDKPKFVRWVLYCFLVFAVLFFMNTDKTSFIYFRF
ncbi:MAG: MBOAT family O-acyltransferase, partial [Flavobacterium sp.]